MEHKEGRRKNHELIETGREHRRSAGPIPHSEQG